jgi:hypothetical protein
LEAEMRKAERVMIAKAEEVCACWQGIPPRPEPTIEEIKMSRLVRELKVDIEKVKGK